MEILIPELILLRVNDIRQVGTDFLLYAADAYLFYQHKDVKQIMATVTKDI